MENDIVEILQKKNIPFRFGGEHHHVSRGWIGVDCPWCNTKGKFHLGINLEKGIANCWICGAKNLGSVLKRLGISIRLGKTRPRKEEEEEEEVKIEPPNNLCSLTENPFRGYIEGRGFDPEEIERVWGVKGIPIKWRLWIPVYQNNKLVAYTTRAIGNVSPRYISTGRIKKYLYGVNFCRNSIIVCEGPIDVWRIGKGAVATFGIPPSREQLSKIASFPTRVFCFDSEAKAQEIAKLSAEKIRSYPGKTYIVKLDTGKDPAEAMEEEIDFLRKKFLRF